MSHQQIVTYPPEPLWTEKIFKTDSGEDFLGIQSVQNNIVGYLLPGIITITTRARYYSFYSWLISEYGHGHPKGWSLNHFVKRREQAFVMANLIYHWSLGRTDRVGGLLGSNVLSKHAANFLDRDSIPYFKGKKGDDYLRASAGGYSTFAGVMNALEITHQPVDSPDELMLLPIGQKLAETFAQAIQDTDYFSKRSKYDESEQIPKKVLLEYGEQCYLNSLDHSPDGSSVLDTLFSLDSANPLPDPEQNSGPRSNMRGTLGLILEIIKQADRPVGENEFRQAIMYGLCNDYPSYKPANEFKPFIAHWQIYQMREYYVYALYALWEYFLLWLRRSGPQSLENLWHHLDQEIDLNAVPNLIRPGSIQLPNPSSVSLAEYLDLILTINGIAPGQLAERCAEYATYSQTPFSEEAIFQVLSKQRKDKVSLHIGAAWMLLVNIYLRLQGLKREDAWEGWYWARYGGARRRSPKLFLEHMASSLESGDSVLDVWIWLFRDYIVAQHTITALEKWSYRSPPANTFHFNYVEGFFEWVHNDNPSYSASRFNRAYDMLFDLGLFEVDEMGVQTLTQRGEQTLDRVLKCLHD
jgi:hypothetical protein